MGCLSALVGLTHSCEQVDGRVYVGQLGITEKELTDYMSSDNGSVGSFLADRISWAEEQVNLDILTYYRPIIKPWTFLDQGRIGEADDLQTLLTATAATLNGIVMDVCVPQSNVKLQLSSISIWSNVGGDVPVLVYDLTDGSLLTTITVTGTTAGSITTQDIDVVLTIKRRNVKLLFVHSLANFYKVNVHGGGCTTCHGGYYQQGPVKAYGARIGSAATKSYANVEKQTQTAGLSIVASLVCDHGQWLCENKSMLAVPMGYKVAELCVQYGKGNADRFNNRAGQDDYLNDRIRMFNTQYKDAMETLYKGMPFPTDPVCFVCNKTVKTAVVIP